MPAISHSVAGPLGVTHLPRLWLKAILKATGTLADGWNSGSRGMDQFLVDDLDVPHEALFAFLETVPRYAECEAWVRAHAGKIDEAAIAAHNTRILNHNMTPQYGIPRRAELGFSETSIWNAVLLNDLDDWNCLRAFVLARDVSEPPAIVLVSSACAGLLGVKHLPRLWAKALIASPELSPVDAATLALLGLDERETAAYLAQRPTYLEFERWAGERTRTLDPRALAAHNASPLELAADVAAWDAIHDGVCSSIRRAKRPPPSG